MNVIKAPVAAWLPQKAELDPFYEGMASFVRDFLVSPSYPHGQFKATTPKSIVDPLVGYIRLNRVQVVLLDTKLFQRLRKIRQLGLAHFVYPSLGYSRFEHTLGVLGRLDQVLNRLIETCGHDRKHGNTIYDLLKKYDLALRLAAQCHDLGHSMFSHVTERVMSDLPGHSNYPSARTIRKLFTEHFGKPKTISLAEVLSITMLACDQMTDSLVKVNTPPDEAASALEAAARFIIGLPIADQPDTMFLGQLLSSGFDVDKLDYMPREAHFSGIHVEIDIQRLLDKLRVFAIKPAQLPEDYAPYKQELPEGTDAYVLGFARGGQFAFEEFCVARVALWDKIYLHQKVRGAEAQLAAHLQLIPKRFPEFNEVHRWLYLKESMIGDNHARLPTLEYPDGFFGTLSPSVGDLGECPIDDRGLCFRAFGFGVANSLSEPEQAQMTPAASQDKPSPTHALVKLIDSERDKFIDDVLAEADAICDALEIARLSGLDRQLIVELPRYDNVQQGQKSIYLERSGRVPIRWTMPIDHIVEYYRDHRALAYVYAFKKMRAQ